MKLLFFKREHTRTAFIHLNTRKCKACWECLTICPNQVIGKVDLSFHKHALIVNPSGCTGCLKCIKTCKFEAYTKTQK
jgi:2-oxoglutarate ferredoxin oxidoreductase subunit delta